MSDIEPQSNFISRWPEVLKSIFGEIIPDECVWTIPADIISVLNKIAAVINHNHTYLPNGGGFDLMSAHSSHERNCIEINEQCPSIVQPASLIFISFPKTPDLSYFSLATKPLRKTNVRDEDSSEFFYEELIEIAPEEYLDYHKFHQNGYGYMELPESNRHVIRYLKGTFLIVSQCSPFHHNDLNYDGRHNNMDSVKLKEYIKAHNRPN